MELDLSYLPQEDRMRLSLRGQADWLVTRSLLTKLLPVWVERLESIELPNVGIPLGQRDLSQEHALSLEFDGPKTTRLPPTQSYSDVLLLEVKLTIDPLGATLHFLGHGRETTFSLTRKESHTFLEMMTKKARLAGWLDSVQLPAWLGTT